MNGLTNYVSCGVLWLGLGVKAPDLVRHRHDPYLRAICAVLGLAGLCFFLGAPPTVGAVNHLSGVPNLAAPLTYAAITAYGAASQVLIVRWRGGPDVRRTARRWITAYAGVILGIGAAFALGDAPVERRTDLDTYYATTPFIGEMIVLYLVAHLVAATVTLVSALAWARQVTGWLRAGLLVLGVGTLGNAGYSAAKLVAVTARWSGRDWTALDTAVSPAAAGLGALLTAAGILIPLTAPRLARWRRAGRAYARLAPLERELDGVLTRHALRLPRPRWATPPTRLMWRQTSIHNALGHLDGSYDPLLYAETREAALRATGDTAHARATAWAAVIAAAAHRDGGATPVPPPRLLRVTAPLPAGVTPPHACEATPPTGAPRLAVVAPPAVPAHLTAVKAPAAVARRPEGTPPAGGPHLTAVQPPAAPPHPTAGPPPGGVAGPAGLPGGGPGDLLEVADALAGSPLVAAVRRRARAGNGVRPV